MLFLHRTFPITASNPFSLSIRAAMGALIGVAIAALLVLASTSFADKVDLPIADLIPSNYLNVFLNAPWQERYEKYFYLLSIFLGGIGALLTLRSRIASQPLTVLPLQLKSADAIAFYAFLAVVFLAVKPSSVTAIATTLTDPHIGSYLFAPAINYLAPNAIPGKDFESHYGLGLPFLFSKLLGETFEQSTFRAAIVMLLCTVLFHATVFASVRILTNSLACSVVTASFIFASAFDGFSFSIPSDLPLRFLLCPTFIVLCAIAPSARRQRLMTAFAGATAGVAIIWQTDTGIYCAIAGLLVFGVLAILRKISIRLFFWFFTCLAVTFLVALVGIVGFDNFSLGTISRLFEPIFLYSGGFGSTAMQWSSYWSLIYNLGTPVIIAATAGFAFFNLASNRGVKQTQPQIAALLLLALFSAASLFKWVNRSIDVLWWLNAWPLIMLLGLAWCVATSQLKPLHRISLGWSTVFLILGSLFIGATSEIALSLSRSPALRWHHYFYNHPSTLSDMYLKARGSTRDPASRRHERVIEIENTNFIRSRTKPGVPIVVLSKTDWHYLLDAKRPGLLYWTPLHLTHTYSLLSRNIEQLKLADVVYLERGYSETLRQVNEGVHRKVFQLLDTDYYQDETNGNWMVLHKTRPTPLTAQ